MFCYGQIAPLAVSDVAMLAPEEVFSGKGDIKEEVELTKPERKRRRANKKRKFKGKIIEATGESGWSITCIWCFLITYTIMCA